MANIAVNKQLTNLAFQKKFQECCRENGISVTDEEITDLARKIVAYSNNNEENPYFLSEFLVEANRTGVDRLFSNGSVDDTQLNNMLGEVHKKVVNLYHGEAKSETPNSNLEVISQNETLVEEDIKSKLEKIDFSNLSIDDIATVIQNIEKVSYEQGEAIAREMSKNIENDEAKKKLMEWTHLWQKIEKGDPLLDEDYDLIDDFFETLGIEIDEEHKVEIFRERFTEDININTELPVDIRDEILVCIKQGKQITEEFAEEWVKRMEAPEYQEILKICPEKGGAIGYINRRMIDACKELRVQLPPFLQDYEEKHREEYELSSQNAKEVEEALGRKQNSLEDLEDTVLDTFANNILLQVNDFEEAEQRGEAEENFNEPVEETADRNSIQTDLTEKIDDEKVEEQDGKEHVYRGLDSLAGFFEEYDVQENSALESNDIHEVVEPTEYNGQVVSEAEVPEDELVVDFEVMEEFFTQEFADENAEYYINKEHTIENPKEEQAPEFQGENAQNQLFEELPFQEQIIQEEKFQAQEGILNVQDVVGNRTNFKENFATMENLEKLEIGQYGREDSAWQDIREDNFELQEDTKKSWLDRMRESKNPVAKAIGNRLTAFMNRNNKALNAPQMQQEAAVTPKNFDAEEKSGYGLGDIGLVPTNKIIQSKMVSFAKGITNLFRGNKQEKAGSNVVNQPNQLVGKLSGIEVSDDVKRKISYVEQQARETANNFQTHQKDNDIQKPKIVPKNVKNASVGVHNNVGDDDWLSH